MRVLRWMLVVAVASSLGGWCVAEEGFDGLEGRGPQPGVVTVTIENDAVSNADRHYTSGLRVATLLPEGRQPKWMETALARFGRPDADGRRYEYAFGQQIYTPEDIGKPEPAPWERPYAGWLYASAGMVSRSDRVIDQVELSVGVVGPAALAEAAQRLVHEIIDSTEPRGWDAQIRNEPTLQLFAQRNWWVARGLSSGGWEWDVVPHVGAALGNALTYGNAGLTVCVGSQGGDGFAAPRLGLLLPGNGFFLPGDRGAWQVFGSLEGAYVARNLFLDGSTFRDVSPSVPKKDWVGEAQIGVQFTLGGHRLSYVQVRRTREFVGQAQAETYGALSYSHAF